MRIVVAVHVLNLDTNVAFVVVATTTIVTVIVTIDDRNMADVGALVLRRCHAGRRRRQGIAHRGTGPGAVAAVVEGRLAVHGELSLLLSVLLLRLVEVLVPRVPRLRGCNGCLQVLRPSA